MVKNKIQEIPLDLRETIFKIANNYGIYKPEAFFFVALGYLTLMRNKTLKLNTRREIDKFKLDCAELLSYIKLLGWEAFGPLAKNVFIFWGLKSGKDFIKILDFLVESLIIEKD